ncbi:MAG TPA: dihydroorotate dehydrogenase-like protein [Fimbriimonadaceae bacterium]|nr:dihydroorotate dehydrogenase-like protein [Fimbriimonadaceae bacterium]
MDLKTKYLGLELKHPIVASPSPISQKLDGVRKLEDAGAAAIVLASLFEEQIRFENDSFEYFRQVSSNTFPESMTFFPRSEDFEAGPEEYLELIKGATEACDVPIIASLNACSPEGWAEFAFRMEKAGASALELNAYFIPEIGQTSHQVEQRYVDIVKMVNLAVGIPVAIKLSPYFSSMGEMAKRLTHAGANGLVLFNRLYQPDFDLAELDVVPSLELSRPNEMRLPLLWIANLYGRLDCSLAATTGVHNGTDAVKYILAGADVAMTTSSLLKNGVDYLSIIISEFVEWAERHEYASVSEMRGSMSKQRVEDPSAFDRSNYIKVLQSYLPRNTVP